MTGAGATVVGKPSAHRMRSKARRCALQALYQWQLTAQPTHDIKEQFLDDQDLSQVDLDYFATLLAEVPSHAVEIDAELAVVLDRPVRELDPVELSILRIGVCELAYHIDVPYRVVINEAVELAKTFGAEQSHRYINGVLDKVAHKLRDAELRLGR